jgi:hypothetical protein
MAQMDHNEAVRLQAAEKYVLGELPQSLREDYEEHYFECAECALDLKAAATFVDTSREVLRAEREKWAEKASVAAGGRWFAWFRPMVAAPVFAALLLVVVYQNTVTIPRAKQGARLGAGQVFTSSFSLKKADTLGGEEAKAGDEGKVQVHANEGFALKFDFTPRQRFDSYVGQIQEESGRSVLQVRIPGSSANREVQIAVPSGVVQPGNYALVLAGDPGAKGQMSKENEVSRLSFTVEFRP